MTTYLAVVRTDVDFRNLMHDAARPYAVVECDKISGRVTHVVSRHATYRGAAIACGKRV